MVTIYTTNTCAYCPIVKKYLTAKNIKYEEVDISNDPITRQELFNTTGMMTVPVTTDGNTFVVGYKPLELAKFAN